jgi:hypothetical protein
MKAHSDALIKEFTLGLKRELTAEELDFIKWLAMKISLEVVNN